MAMTAGKLARQYGMSRTALLYYDEIGLVKPSERSTAGYRLYSEADQRRLETVIAYRDAGIPLEEIRRLLMGSGTKLEAVLLKRLTELNQEIIAVKRRQAAVIAIIQGAFTGDMEDIHRNWRDALEEAGFSGEDALRLHAEFEEHSPELHERFLKALGLPDREIKSIREKLIKK